MSSRGVPQYATGSKVALGTDECTPPNGSEDELPSPQGPHGRAETEQPALEEEEAPGRSRSPRIGDTLAACIADHLHYMGILAVGRRADSSEDEDTKYHLETSTPEDLPDLLSSPEEASATSTELQATSRTPRWRSFIEGSCTFSADDIEDQCEWIERLQNQYDDPCDVIDTQEADEDTRDGHQSAKRRRTMARDFCCGSTSAKMLQDELAAAVAAQQGPMDEWRRNRDQWTAKARAHARADESYLLRASWVCSTMKEVPILVNGCRKMRHLPFALPEDHVRKAIAEQGAHALTLVSCPPGAIMLDLHQHKIVQEVGEANVIPLGLYCDETTLSKSDRTFSFYMKILPLQHRYPTCNIQERHLQIGGDPSTLGAIDRVLTQSFSSLALGQCGLGVRAVLVEYAGVLDMLSEWPHLVTAGGTWNAATATASTSLMPPPPRQPQNNRVDRKIYI